MMPIRKFRATSIRKSVSENTLNPSHAKPLVPSTKAISMGMPIRLRNVMAIIIADMEADYKELGFTE